MSVSWSDRREPRTFPARRESRVPNLPAAPSRPDPSLTERSLARDWPRPIRERDVARDQAIAAYAWRAVVFFALGAALGWNIAFEQWETLPVHAVLDLWFAWWMRPGAFK